MKIVGTGASTANQHMPHFADDVFHLLIQFFNVICLPIGPVGTVGPARLLLQLGGARAVCGRGWPTLPMGTTALRVPPPPSQGLTSVPPALRPRMQRARQTRGKG